MREVMKKNWKSMLLAAVIILLPMAVGVKLWDRLPEQVATHWSFDGEPNGWTSRAFTVYGIPLVMLALHMVCLLVSESDTNSCGQNPKLKRLMYWVIPAVSLILCASVYPYALGLEIPMQRMALLFLGVLLLVIGNYLPKCRQNYWMGIKLPWTFASEENWNATHRFAGKVYVIVGVLSLICAFIQVTLFSQAMIVVILVACMVPMGYSYWYSRKEGKKE